MRTTVSFRRCSAAVRFSSSLWKVWTAVFTRATVAVNSGATRLMRSDKIFERACSRRNNLLETVPKRNGRCLQVGEQSAFLASSFKVASSFSISTWSFCIRCICETVTASASRAATDLVVSEVKRNAFTKLEHSKNALSPFEIWNAAFMSPCVLAWASMFCRPSAMILPWGVSTSFSTATRAL